MKHIIAILLVLSVVFCLTACSSVDDEKKFVEIDKYRAPYGQTIVVVYDPVTKVEYFMMGDTMCPRYDENGNIAFYEGD
jgi:hypothetical protein